MPKSQKSVTTATSNSRAVSIPFEADESGFVPGVFMIVAIIFLY
jgi:hypothetical protein